jgi:hypothetical protein
VTTTPPYCGDGTINGDTSRPELCDPDDGTPVFVSNIMNAANNKRCHIYDTLFLDNSGNLGCNGECDYDYTFLSSRDLFGCNLPSNFVATCGDGIVISPETCDGDSFGVHSCMTEGYSSGNLKCTSAASEYPCQIDTSGCTRDVDDSVIGDGVIDRPNSGGVYEECDPNTIADSTFGSPVFIEGEENCPDDDVYDGTGTLRCNGLSHIDYTLCDLKPNVVLITGDGYVNKMGEECDINSDGTREDLQGMSCELFGYDMGTLSCYPADYVDENGNNLGGTFDKTDCQIIPWMGECGDGAVDNPKEECDIENLQGRTCRSLGYKRGLLKCKENCKIDKSECSGVLGELDFEKKKIGNCKVETTDVTGTCAEDSMITYKWTGEWTWAAENVPRATPGDGYVLDGANYYYDPNDAKQECVTGGTRSVPCPSQLQLPFFDLYNIAATIIMIGIIYAVILLRKRK